MTRQLALVAVVFVAVLVLLAGIASVPGSSPPITVNGSPVPVAVRSAAPSAAGTPSPADPSGTSGSPGASGGAGPSGPAPSASAASDPVLVGAGDIAKCDSQGDEATATLLDGIDGTVFAAGDDAYENGTAAEFRDCYAPTWGQQLARTYAVPGNHDWGTKGLSGYLGYFGARGSRDGKTWYSFELGSWHVVMLDTECSKVGGCGADSPQGRWLTADLAASKASCTLAIWHRPRWSSGLHGNDRSSAFFWQALYAAGADLVINGHDHDYERFAPQDPSAREDRVRGIREFVVGTGGAELRAFHQIAANSELRIGGLYGVIKLTLKSNGYDWRFIPTESDVSDAGSAPCH